MAGRFSFFQVIQLRSNERHDSLVAQHGVNLGGWFIPEKWMTPELFAGTDASDTIGLLQTDIGIKRYNAHVRTFIEKKDLELLAQHKVQIVRVPVAWWMVDLEFDSVAKICGERLDWLFACAEEQGIQVLLDFHGARGSQNGKDHSGKIGSIAWSRYHNENIGYLKIFAERYGQSSALWGIELLNEPAVRHHYWSLYRYYKSAKRQLRILLPQKVRIVIHDGFIPLLFTNIAPRRSRTILDLHLYELPVKKNESLQEYFDRRDKTYSKQIHFLKRFQPVIIGEWSGVVPEQFLRGLSTKEREEVIRENIRRQYVIYDEADAWMFWSMKTADQMMWNFEKFLQRVT